MALTLEDLEALQRKELDPIIVGEIPFAIGQQLQLRIFNVYMSRNSLLHIQQDHPDILLIDMLLLPFCVSRGLLVQEKAKPNVLIASYQDFETGKRFVAVMKTIKSGTEIWLSSFYRSRKRQTASILKRSRILKTHD